MKIIFYILCISYLMLSCDDSRSGTEIKEKYNQTKNLINEINENDKRDLTDGALKREEGIHQFKNQLNSILFELNSYCVKVQCNGLYKINNTFNQMINEKEVAYKAMLDECEECFEEFTAKLAYKNNEYIFIDFNTLGLYGGAHNEINLSQQIFSLRTGEKVEFIDLLNSNSIEGILVAFNDELNNQINKIEKCIDDNEFHFRTEITKEDLKNISIGEKGIALNIDLLPNSMNDCEPSLFLARENVKLILNNVYP